MILTHETNFKVYPPHTNSMAPLIFGGAFFSEMDKTAANLVCRFLASASSVCSHAVTHQASTIFHKPCYLGDLLFVRSEVMSVGKKSIVVRTVAERESFACKTLKREMIAECDFVFVSIANENATNDKPNMLPYMCHGIDDEQVQKQRELLYFEQLVDAEATG